MGIIVKTGVALKTTIPNGTGISGVIDMRDYSMGQIIVPSAWTAAAIAFKVCDTPGGTFVPLCGATGAVVEISGVLTSNSAAYPLPAELLSSMFFQVWSETSGSSTNQGADRILTVVLKS